jgi:hypothetical protein
MFKYTQKDINRFYKHINIIEEGPDAGCWETDYCNDRDGYTHFNLSNGIGNHRIKLGSHRFMYQIQNPDENIDGLLVCHSCDHPWCVNPDHLWLGTSIDNMKDMTNKNRQAKGSNHALSILNENNIKCMLNDILSGKLTNIAKIATKYNVGLHNIYNILYNKTWSHVTKDYDLIKIKTLITKNYGSLSYSDVRNIRTRLKTGESQSSIARSYNLSTSLISSIKCDRAYKNVI